jgi:hypothetical protein
MGRVRLIGVLGLVACGSATYEERDPYFVRLDAGPAAHDAGVVHLADAGTHFDAGTARDAGPTATQDAGLTDAGAPVCSMLTCSGCCNNTVCDPGQTVASCGQNGATCAICTGTDRCGTSQRCELDPTTRWLVQPTAATIQNKAWDTTSGPDTTLSLWCPATHAMANGGCDKVSDSYTPTWSSGGCIATAGDLLSGGFGFTAADVDVFSDDEICGFTTIAVTEAQLRAGRLDVPAMCGLVSMTVTLTRQ